MKKLNHPGRHIQEVWKDKKNKGARQIKVEDMCTFLEESRSLKKKNREKKKRKNSIRNKIPPQKQRRGKVSRYF